MTTHETSTVIELLEEATMCEAGDIAADAALSEVPGWDSMGMVMFIGLITERFGVELSSHDIRECETAEALAQRVTELLSD